MNILAFVGVSVRRVKERRRHRSHGRVSIVNCQLPNKLDFKPSIDALSTTYRAQDHHSQERR